MRWYDVLEAAGAASICASIALLLNPPAALLAAGIYMVAAATAARLR